MFPLAPPRYVTEYMSSPCRPVYEHCEVLARNFDCVVRIQEMMKLHGQEPVSFADVKDEIFDMVKPQDPLRITLQVFKALSLGK